MLKSIVNGAEHDIVSIPMKGKNLLDYEYLFSNNIDRESEYFRYYKLQLDANTQYIFSSNAPYTVEGNQTTFMFGLSNIMTTVNNGVFGIKYMMTDSTGIAYVAIRIKNGASVPMANKTDYDNGTYTIMLNTGSTVLPYEPYGYQEGWEIRDNQNRLIWGREDELQTTTGTLPFKGYDLPVKVKSLLGNTVQNGTPSPDNIVIPEMCGARTANVMPFAAAQTITNNGITFTSDGKGGYTAKGYSTGTARAVFQLSDTFIIPNSVGNGGNGTLSYWNTKADSVVFGFMFNDTVIDEWSMNVVNRQHNAYTIIANQKCNAIRLSLPASRSCDQKIQPELTDNGEYPTEFEPYGWKIPFENHGENLWDEDYTGISGDLKYVPVFVGDGTFTMSTDTPSYSGNAPLFLLSGNVTSGASTPTNGVYNGVSRTTNSSNGYITISFRRQSESANPITHKTMLNPGSTALPYSPYINETTPVYLGEVPTVRRIKKVVFTGQETWTEVYPGEPEAQAQGIVMYATSLSEIGTDRNDFRCSHFFVGNYRGYLISGQGRINGTYTSAVPEAFNVNYNNGSGGLQNFKAWLASEYTEGHPVTLWYALATEQTSVVNEPLCKISTYADELTTIQVHGLSAPLYGIGNYKDILNLSTGVVTRNVKKWVLTGNETGWQKNSISENNAYYRTVSDYYRYNGLCSHYATTASEKVESGIFFGKGINFLTALSDEIDTVDKWKSFLATQYANGTPVTVWYVISTPTTETVTVPTGMTGEIEGYLTQISIPTPTRQSIPKWNGKEETGGTYAVTVYTPPEIPTTTGQNTLTVETEKIHGVTSPLCGIGDYKDVLNLSTGIITRKIKKYVFTGEENGTIYSTSTIRKGIEITGITGIIGGNADIAILAICTHYQPYTRSALYRNTDNGISNSYQNDNIIFYDASYQTVEDFQQFCTQQYANGTPVTVWYVLETPETETITVPYGLDCTVDGYLTQSGTPTPSNPITPDSNGILESGGTYAVEVSLVPSNLIIKGHIKPVP